MRLRKPGSAEFETLPRTGRREFVGLGLAAVAAWASGKVWAADPPAPAMAPPAAAGPQVTIELFSAAGTSGGIVRVAKVVKTEAEWRAQLTPLAFAVTRRSGTEIAFSGAYAESHADGIYRCICCDTALYDSRTKYDSGTGWPSFWRAISAQNVVKSSDTSLMMQRDAISCKRCDAHLGHVFDDGPRPTGLRYCMNSVALQFAARA